MFRFCARKPEETDSNISVDGSMNVPDTYIVCDIMHHCPRGTLRTIFVAFLVCDVSRGGKTYGPWYTDPTIPVRIGERSVPVLKTDAGGMIPPRTSRASHREPDAIGITTGTTEGIFG